MTRAITYLGRKFLFCAITSVLILIGSRVAKPGTFEAASTALVALAGIFCGTNTLAGIKGVPVAKAE
jgi:hypothetical protein